MIMMIEGTLFLLLLIFTAAHATKAFPLPGYTFIYPRWSEIAEPATVVGAVDDSKKCSPTNYVQGGMWWAFLFVAIVLIALTGLLAGLTLSVMSVDLAKLTVLNETGDAKQKCVLFCTIKSYSCDCAELN